MRRKDHPRMTADCCPDDGYVTVPPPQEQEHGVGGGGGPAQRWMLWSQVLHTMNFSDLQGNHRSEILADSRNTGIYRSAEEAALEKSGTV